MDAKTRKAYQEKTKDYFNRYIESAPLIDPVKKFIPPPAKILDYGTGSGRDLSALLDAGYDAYGYDPVSQFIELAASNYPETEGRYFDNITSLKTAARLPFDAVLINAVLQHIEDEELFDFFFTVTELLQKKNNSDSGSYLMISIPAAYGNLNDDSRDKAGRFFKVRSAYYYQHLLERFGYTHLWQDHSQDNLSRQGIVWVTMVFRLEYNQMSRPIDRIEGLLNQEKKTATYKLALFRAIADIAAQRYQSVIWYKTDNNEPARVGLPMYLIVEKIIEYYWPITETEIVRDIVIPQINGANNRPAFAELLKVVIEETKNAGGLIYVLNELATGYKHKNNNSNINKLYKIVHQTMVKGPIYYSGKSAGTGERMFNYDKSHDCMVMEAELWHEFTQMYYWIKAALVLKWAELTESMAKQSGINLRANEVLSILMQETLVSREQSLVRKLIFEDKPPETCVWSGKTLKSGYDIDHIIPFSLWNNNDLWNLLPASSTVNRTKSDKLPTNNIMKKRKDNLIYYWELFEKKQPDLFYHDLNSFLGHGTSAGNWQNFLFSSVFEAVEFTARQRNIPRWEP